MTTDDEFRKKLIADALLALIPSGIVELEPLTPENRQARAQRYSATISEHGDKLLFNAGKVHRGESALGSLALGIAALAYQPGGVTVEQFGIHACVEGHEGCPSGNTPGKPPSKFGHVYLLPE